VLAFSVGLVREPAVEDIGEFQVIFACQLIASTAHQDGFRNALTHPDGPSIEKALHDNAFCRSSLHCDGSCHT